MKTKLLTIFAVFLLSLSFASAVVVSEVTQQELFPSEETNLDLKVKNTLNDDIEDVSLNLVFDNTPFIPIGGSEDGINEIRDGSTKNFQYRIKASQDIIPGDYNIPYEITYLDTGKDEIFTKSGSIGVIVSAKTELDYSVEVEDNVIGEQGKVTLKIINLGFGNIKFVNVEIVPQGFTLLGSVNDYIGTIDSDDFESATYDVIFKDENARLVAIVTYKDFDNNEETITVDLGLTVYSREEAIELGIIEKSNTLMYLVTVIVLVIAYFVYKNIKKRKKLKKRA